MLLDKGYKYTETEVRRVFPKKKRVGGVLTVADLQENEVRASDRVIVENYFGRQGVLCGVVSNKYRWSEESYDNIFS